MHWIPDSNAVITIIMNNNNKDNNNDPFGDDNGDDFFYSLFHPLPIGATYSSDDNEATLLPSLSQSQHAKRKRRTKSPKTTTTTNETKPRRRPATVSSSSSPIPTNVHPYDILCARSVTYHKHPGNVWYGQLIASLAQDYATCQRREDKARITAQIMHAVQERGGRFVRPSGNDDEWVELEFVAKREKICHALRSAQQKQQKQNGSTAATLLASSACLRTRQRRTTTASPSGDCGKQQEVPSHNDNDINHCDKAKKTAPPPPQRDEHVELTMDVDLVTANTKQPPSSSFLTPAPLPTMPCLDNIHGDNIFNNDDNDDEDAVITRMITAMQPPTLTQQAPLPPPTTSSSLLALLEMDDPDTTSNDNDCYNNNNDNNDTVASGLEPLPFVLEEPQDTTTTASTTQRRPTLLEMETVDLLLLDWAKNKTMDTKNNDKDNSNGGQE